MKSSDRAVLLGIGIVGIVAVFWFMVLSPKRAEVKEFDDQIVTLEQSVAAAEQTVAIAETAKASYADDYHRVVVLGKAVPADGDTASLLEQTVLLSDKAKVDFRGMKLAAAAASSAQPVAPAPVPAEGETPEGETAAPPTEGTLATAAPAPATEAAAATLPIGAAVGPAGLPTMPYDLRLLGDFFSIADFMSEIDSLVRVDADGIGVNGRLLTVDGFSLKPDETLGYPNLDVSMAVTSYVTPVEQGLTAGATATAPAASTPGVSTPVSAPVATVAP